MNGTIVHSRFRFHLPAAIAMMLAGGCMLGVNLHPRVVYE
jgi:hypothetical protein